MLNQANGGRNGSMTDGDVGTNYGGSPRDKSVEKYQGYELSFVHNRSMPRTGSHVLLPRRFGMKFPGRFRFGWYSDRGRVPPTQHAIGTAVLGRRAVDREPDRRRPPPPWSGPWRPPGVRPARFPAGHATCVHDTPTSARQ